MSRKKRYLKLPPEVGDGQHHEIAPLDGIEEKLWLWLCNARQHEAITISFVELTDEQFDSLDCM